VVIGNTIIRLIDTPGICDTHSIEQDRKIIANILSTLRSLNELYGILILPKSNYTRWTVGPHFCMKELLSRLHRDAARNIAFGFTNTRQANYTPGDSFKPLQILLEEYRDPEIRLLQHTVYCFDSESFRFVAAYKSGVVMDNIEDSRRSWQQLAKETTRLLQHFRSLSPHLVKSTLSLNETRKSIMHLARPMVEIKQSIDAAIRQCERWMRELNDMNDKRDILRAGLYIQKIEHRVNILAEPRMVCADTPSVEYQDDGHGKRNNCLVCKHSWQEHLQVNHEILKEYVTVKDSSVEDQLKRHEMDLGLKRAAVDSMTKLVESISSSREISKMQPFNSVCS
jgi:hypothetical protein